MRWQEIMISINRLYNSKVLNFGINQSPRANQIIGMVFYQMSLCTETGSASEYFLFCYCFSTHPDVEAPRHYLYLKLLEFVLFEKSRPTSRNAVCINQVTVVPKCSQSIGFPISRADWLVDVWATPNRTAKNIVTDTFNRNAQQQNRNNEFHF